MRSGRGERSDNPLLLQLPLQLPPEETHVTMKGLGDLMKQAQEMQSRLADAQTEIAAMEVIGESGAGLVKVTMNGRYEVKRVTIDPFVMSEQTEVLEDLLAAACNDTVRKVEKAQSDKMGALTGGLNLPFGNLNS